MPVHEAPLDLYIVSYDDPAAAQQDWEDIKHLVKDKVVSVEALVLVNRADDGKIHIKDNAHSVGAGAAIGAVSGALLGLIFPPSLLAAAVVGGGIGAGAGAAVKQLEKHQVMADVEQTLPPGSSGIVVLLEERWGSAVEKALAKASKSEHHHAHEAS
ncbi:MAG TPA: DUF1269 domain-containing protein [Microlunatus sp.]